MAVPQMQLEDWLDDLCVRFIINLPEEDLSSVARICFQVEEAQWFYEDFIRPLDPSLPSMSLRTFCLRIFQHCPLLASFSVENHTRAFEEFLQYKTRVPVRGAILLNEEMDSTVLVKGWKKGANWSFPRGKINKDEDDLDCAVREVWEETGLDLRAAGLVPTEGKPKYIEISMREQQMRLYVFRDVPMDTNFQPQTRKEISKIQWYKLSELPAFRKKGQNQPEAPTNANKFYMVAPFLVPLKKWVMSQKKIEAKKITIASNRNNLNPHFSVDEAPTEDDVWLHHEAPPAHTHGKAIDTLEGATNELQRLLKVQPPTQGLQPATQEDKATALLSMLKIGGPPGPGPQQHAAQKPPPAAELPLNQVPQPQNPYHQHTSHLQPQSFHTEHPQQPPQGSSWDPAHPQYAYQNKHHIQQFDGPAQQNYGNYQPPLVHPQPLPPQVQRSMYNKSTFQDQLLSVPSQQQNYNQVPQPQHQPPPGYGFQAPQQAQQQQTRPPQQIQPQQPPPNSAPQNRLDGQHMALLSAFKRDTGISPSFQPKLPVAPQENHSVAQPPQYTAQLTPNRGQIQPTELAGSAAPNLPLQERRPSAHVPTEQQKSDLLGMFKNKQASSTAQLQEAPAPIPVPVQAPGPAPVRSEQLLGMFRRGPSGHEPSHQPTEQQQQQQQQSLNSGVALSDFLALKPNADQRVISHSRDSNQPSFSQRQPSAASNPPNQPQPIRILQRGAEQPHFGQLRPENPNVSHSPHSTQSQVGSANFASPQISNIRASPAGLQRQQSQQSQHSAAPQDQKRQLLSLFGGNKQPTAPTSATPGVTDIGSENGTPTRPGSGTPMSPADQTFLLDYLQSVTGSAKR